MTPVFQHSAVIRFKDDHDFWGLVANFWIMFMGMSSGVARGPMAFSISFQVICCCEAVEVKSSSLPNLVDNYF